MFYFIRNFDLEKLRLGKGKKNFYNTDADVEVPMPKIPNGQLTLVFVILKNKEADSEPCQTLR